MGLLRVGRGIDLLPLPGDEGALRAYIGSVAIDGSGRYVAATSPKGGLAGLWSLADGRWLGGFKMDDVCGLAQEMTDGPDQWAGAQGALNAAGTSQRTGTNPDS